jgi:hypothetical protein
LDFPISEFLKVIKGEEQQQLHEVFTKPTPPAKPQNAFAKLMANAKPNPTKFQSKFTAESVTKFIAAYENAPNKP